MIDVQLIIIQQLQVSSTQNIIFVRAHYCLSRQVNWLRSTPSFLLVPCRRRGGEHSKNGSTLDRTGTN